MKRKNNYSDRWKASHTLEERIIRAIQNTWSAIAYDIMGMEGTEFISDELMLEMVLDADRIHAFGEDKEAYDWFTQQPKDEQERLAKQALNIKD